MATAIPDDFKRVGYKNGRIPDCGDSPNAALRSVPGLAGIKLHPQAAEQLGKLLEAAARAGFVTGNKENQIWVAPGGGGYRTVDQQIATKAAQGAGAATPETSMHGWGTAVDIAQLYRAAESRAAEVNKLSTTQPKVNRFSASVHAWIRSNNPLYKWLNDNAPKYGWVNPGWAKNGGDVDECWHWEYQAWPNLPDYVQFKPSVANITTRCGEDTPVLSRVTITPQGRSPDAHQNAISPYIASLESFHPNIQYELTRRRISAETANVYMPFVKLTSLTKILPDNLQGGGLAWCPSLGPHGENEVTFDEIYTPKDNRSIIGYATGFVSQEGTEARNLGRVPVVVKESATRTDQRNIPMPGIVEMTAERGTAGPMGVRGGLLKADIKIVAYSIGQVDTLLRYFLRPATRVVLEFGRKSATKAEQPLKPYDWNKPMGGELGKPKGIADQFNDLILHPEAQREFINEYVYSNNGNYEIFIGYVVKFDLKYDKNNVYNINLTVHSVQQYEIPIKHTGVKSLCPSATDKCEAMDVQEYFSTEYSWKQKTFSKLMKTVLDESYTPDNTRKAGTTWGNHFIPLKNPTTDNAVAGRQTGLDESEYLVSWRFFVEKILLDEQLGIIALIKDDNTKKLIRRGLLQPIQTGSFVSEKNLIANEVGYHTNLRSIDPNVMIIYNETAQNSLSEDEKQRYVNIVTAALIKEDSVNTDTLQSFNSNKTIENLIVSSTVGSFRHVKSKGPSTEAGIGNLTDGIWLNTKAIKQAFTTTDTVSNAINSLLTMMNTATEGYWNLQLYSSERPVSGLYVIDMGVSKPVCSPVGNEPFPWIDKEGIEFMGAELDSIKYYNTPRRYQLSGDNEGKNRPRYIYMFNRGTKRLTDGEIGSELLDLNVEFNLPQVIAVQAIAGVGGPAQKSTLQSIDIPELNKINLIENVFSSCTSQDEICVNSTCPTDEEYLQALSEFSTARANYAEAQKEANRPTPAGTAGRDEVAAVATAARRQAEISRQAAEINRTQAKVAKIAVTRYGATKAVQQFQQLSNLGTMLGLVEFNPGGMVKKLNIDSINQDEFGGRTGTPQSKYKRPYTHAFNSSNLTKTISSVTLPGIGGIELFQSFLIDRIPSILERGYYIVTKVTHKFSSSNGWITTIEGRFRFRPDNECSSSGTEYPHCVESSVPPSTTPPAPGTTPFQRAFPQSGAASTFYTGQSAASVALSNAMNRTRQATPATPAGPPSAIRPNPR